MTPQGHPASSYYVATAKGLEQHPALAGAEKADVCVIGAGFTGLSTAIHLAERGFSVIVLEAERVGWGASGRNGGQLGTTHRKDQQALETMLGREWAHRLWSLAVDGLSTVKGLIANNAIDCDLKPGILHTAWKEREAPELRAEVEHMQREYGVTTLRYVPADEAHEMVATKRYHGAILDMGGAHLHPLNYCLGLARTAVAKGVRIFENSRVTDIAKTDPARVTTEQGSVTAGHVVLACNAYLGNLAPRIAGHIMPVNNFILATEPLGEAGARALIRDDVGVQDTKFVIDYYRLSADHRLLFGGGENYSGRLPRDLAAFVRKPMLRVFPQLKDVRIDYAWSGTLAITLPRIPDFGRIAPNIFYAQGYSGQGINIATLAGKLLAEAVAGQAERFDWMADIKVPNFPGGTWLRYPGLLAGVWWYTLKDRLP
ncbi:FAD-binding oxidoreductase [Parvibaculum sp.]|uniref:NAD(P)/FAD-dependent oxidoreductase n=1 Tax=Parvibaculum sp. TaxID=2024848 RepID=UPI00320EF087